MNAPSRDALPLVFLHAYPLDGSMWEREVERFAGRRVLNPHFPGFGGRSPDSGSLHAFAEAIIADLDRAGIQRAVFVGLSMGGYVAFRLHAGWPERVAALVLADTRAGPDAEAGRDRRTQQAERVRSEGVEWLPDALLPSLLGETTRREAPEVVARVREIILRSNPEGVARAVLAIRDRPDSRGELSRITVPVLAIVGEEDELTPRAEAEAIVAGVPDGRLVVIPRAGHLSNLENPEAFGTALAAFVAEVSGADWG